MDDDEHARETWRDRMVKVRTLDALTAEYWQRVDIPENVKRESIERIPGSPTREIWTRLTTATNPYAAWALNVELTRRGVPPCVRRSALAPDATTAYIELAADLQWIVERHTGFTPRFPRSQRIYREAPRGDWWLSPTPSPVSAGIPPLYEVEQRRKWGQTIFQLMLDKHGDNHKISLALGLTEDMRRQSFTLPSKAQYTARRELSAKSTEIHDELITHALSKPDKSGIHRPDDVARRDSLTFEAYIRLHGNVPESLHYLKEIHGLKLPRQRFVERVEKCRSFSAAANSVARLVRPPESRRPTDA